MSATAPITADGGGQLGGATPPSAFPLSDPRAWPTPPPHTEAACFALTREIANVETVATFTIDGEPVSKSRARFDARGSKTRAFTPEKTKTAEVVVGWKFRAAAPGYKTSATKTYGVFGLFFAGTRQRRDVDNMLKLICDGLTGVAWADDSQVVEVSGRRGYDNRENARTEVWIYEVGVVPLGVSATCDECGKKYRSYPSWESKRRFCSFDCRNTSVARGHTRTCEHCKQTFVGRADRKYCGRECRSLAKTVEVTCTQCGVVERIPFSLRAPRSPVCRSSECQAAYWRARRKTGAVGVCATCGGPTSKKTYVNCQPCRNSGPEGRAAILAARADA